MTERRRKRTKLFTNDVRSLLYAFGDVEDPHPETVNCLEDVLVNFIIDTCHDASAFARVTRRTKIKVDDFKFALKSDPVKYGRVFELLNLQKIITDARKQFDNSEGKSMKNLQDVQGNDDDDDLDGDENDDENGRGGSNLEKDVSRRDDGNDNNDNNNSNNNKRKEDPDKKPKRKYTKSGKERKPYKKRAKKSDILSSSASAS